MTDLDYQKDQEIFSPEKRPSKEEEYLHPDNIKETAKEKPKKASLKTGSKVDPSLKFTGNTQKSETSVNVRFSGITTTATNIVTPVTRVIEESKKDLDAIDTKDEEKVIDTKDEEKVIDTKDE